MKIVTVILVGLLVAILLVSEVSLAADDDTSVGAEVEVLPGGNISYGVRVDGSRRALFPDWALGEPDGRGAFIFLNGWISIELKEDVNNARAISVWVANRGWQSSNMKVYVSSDGYKWEHAGAETVKSIGFTRNDFTGSFGNVKYIKVNRSGGPWSFMRLDAVGAKGGDEGKQEEPNTKRR